MTQEPQQDRCATRRGVLLGVGLAGIGGALAGCSTASVPYDANEAGQAPGTEATSSPSAAAGMQAGPAGSGTGNTAGGSMGGSGGGSAQGGTGGSGQGGTGESAQGGTGSAGGGAANTMSGALLGLTSEIPLGGGKVFMAHQVVVTQPAAGQFRAFSAVCTHVGCICNRVANGTIDCPCHGSTFKVTDGAVVTGPAASPLAAKSIAIKDGKILLL